MLVSAIRWVVPISILTYLVYTLSSMGFLGEHGRLAVISLNDQYDVISNTYVTPKYTKFVKPIVEDKVVPWVRETKERIKLDEKLDVVKKHVEYVDRKYQVSSTVTQYADRAKTRSKLKLLKAKKFVLTHVKKQVTEAIGYVRVHLSVAWEYFKVQSKILYYATKQKVDSTEALQPLSYAWFKIEELHTLLLENSSLLNWQERTNFIKAEFMNLVKFSEREKIPIKKAEEIKQAVKDLLQSGATEGEESEEGDEDLEPSTYYITSTITSTSDSVSTPVVDENELRINGLLDDLERDVNNTLGSALRNLDIEMDPISNETINKIKPVISKKLQTLQVENYKHYQELNTLIKDVHKDYEKIKASNKTVETVTRQQVRDVIAQAYERAENTTLSVQNDMTTALEEILTQYYKVVQSTIDVVESFADTQIQVYSMKLASLIYELKENSEFNDDLVWKGWKRFHAIKEDLFSFRDNLFDDALNYKKDRMSKVPAGLHEWNKYLRNIDFHLMFVNKENKEYLMLVRAKANVAFQLRETTISELENAKVNTEDESFNESEEMQEDKADDLEEGEVTSENNDESNEQDSEYESGELSDA